MTSYGCGNDQTTPIDNAHVICDAHSEAWKPHSKFQCGWLFDQLLIAKITSSNCGYVQTTPICG